MEGNRKSYRIRTGVGNEAPSSINVNLNQTFDMVNVLSLEIEQKNFYKMPAAGYGVIVGRVIANGGFGVPNAKVSVFIPYDRNSLVESEHSLYHYTTPLSKNGDGIRYNLLPRRLDKECHQDVGSMYEKEYLLDNNDLIQVFDKYYKYTAVTNEGGDYFIYGVPVGNQTVHVDLDLSDIGVLSQRPRDMMYKGFGADMFDNPNKFKKDKNLNNLPQIYSQDVVVNVYPFWGDTTVDETNGVITRCDIDIDYTFEPTCVFMGSIVSDTGNRAISQYCVPDDEIGKMSELIAGEGKIEMIRKTFDGKVEEFSIRGNNLIDGDGVWCYQIPMNLDYVMTDEFGNMVPTDDPSKGIPTRTRVRFRISMNETETDDTARKRARFLVPNNPKLNDDYPDFNKTHKADYGFGTFTKDENYRDLFWNKVYTVKSYIPRLQKAKALRRRVHTGIKNVNHSGGHNPFPFNNLFIRLTFTYRFLCTLITLLCVIVYALNSVLGILGVINYYLGKFFAKLGTLNDSGFGKLIFDALLGFMPTISDILAYLLLNSAENMIIKLPNFCDDGNFDQAVYTPMWCISDWFCMTDILQKINSDSDDEYTPIHVYNESLGIDYQFPSNTNVKYENDLSRLFNCVENQLAQDQECTSFNFSNDWVNGVLYAPLWYRKVRNKKKIFFNLIPIPDVDKWCSGNTTRYSKGLSLCQTCAQKREVVNTKEKRVIEPLGNENIRLSELILPSPQNEKTCYGYKCHKKAVSFINVNKGLVVPVETILGDTVYYYKSVEYDNTLRSTKGEGDVKTLFATDIVLLGSLNDCDAEGVPQFFKRLESTTYNMPPDLLQLDYDSDARKISFEPRANDSSVLSAMISMNFGDMGMSGIDDEIDEKLEQKDVYTNKTGADWGNYGHDQVTEHYKDNTNYIFSTSKDGVRRKYAEFPDAGGLFYGLTCWSAYTKPKSCINVSRVCEYGVSLDESQEMPVYRQRLSNGAYAYERVAPDGFISYDELYDMDGRAMFATMNGNNLRTKTNPSNSFPVYDFMYLYPENFDGSLQRIMNINPSVGYPLYPSPQNNNFKAEKSSEAYLRFRYGRNRDDWSISYYNTLEKIGLYTGVNAENKNRFPKYENSFYFYFGLNPGNTAIDKFRTRYYSKCKDDDGEQAVVGIDYNGNSWCSEIAINGGFMPGDGWVKIDATYLDAPYSVYFANMDGNVHYDVWSNDIEEEKIYFSYVGENEDYENEGFVLKPLYRVDGNETHEYGLMNGTYRLTIVDANGYEYRQIIEYTAPAINVAVDRTPFRLNGESLHNYGNLGHGDFYQNVATLGGETGSHMSERNDVGGFIEVTGIDLGGDKYIDFKIEIRPMFSMNKIGVVNVSSGSAPDERSGNIMPTPTAYNGSKMEIHQVGNNEVPVIICDDSTLMKEGFYQEEPYCPYGYDFPQYPQTQPSPGTAYQTNGGNYDFRFGVPVSGRYMVTVTMLCKKSDTYYSSRNIATMAIEVPDPLEFKMLVNGIDYNIIRDFGLGRMNLEDGTVHYGTGWHLLNDGTEFPENYLPLENVSGNLIGWNDLKNIDGLNELGYIPEGEENFHQWDYDTYIKDVEAKLTDNFEESSTPYNWSGIYLFDAESVINTIGKFSNVPEIKQNGSAYIMVLYEDDYVFYKWDTVNEEYQMCYREGGPMTEITTKEYYDEGDLYIKNDFIARLNEKITLRKEFIEEVEEAFVIRRNAGYSMEVTNVTNETPVKTVIWYSGDTGDISSGEYSLLDESKEETECYGITVPTLTGLLLDDWDFKWFENRNDSLMFLGDISFQPLIGTQGYKKPYLIGIQNKVGETLPEYIKQMHVIDGIDGDINELAPCLFGVHMIEGRLRFVYNCWASINGWVYHKESEIEDGGMSGTTPQRTITLPGLFSGFVLDGKPASYEQNGNYPETFFQTQKLDDTNISIRTFSIDSNGAVDENRFPVVRFLYNDEADNAMYVDYKFFDNNVDNLLNNEGMSGKKHFTFGNQYAQVRIADEANETILPLYDEVLAPSVTYEVSNDGYTVNANFEEGWCYTFYDGETNPVYTQDNNFCLTFTEPYLETRDTGTMYFGDKNFNMDENNSYETIQFNGGNTQIWSLEINGASFKKINKIISVAHKDCYPMSTVYAVKISKDGQKRTVSKTFDITRMEYFVTIEPNIESWHESEVAIMAHNVVMNINVGVRKMSNGVLERGFYYLKHYNFSIDVEKDDEGNLAHVDVENGYANNPSIGHGSDTTTKWIKLTIKRYGVGTPISVINDFANQLKGEGCHVFLTDITGLQREMYNTGEYNIFNYSYCLVNG